MKKITYFIIIAVALSVGSVFAGQDANVERLMDQIKAMEARIASLESRFTCASPA